MAAKVHTCSAGLSRSFWGQTCFLPSCSVIRLFGRIEALKNILMALTASIVPVLNAFLIMLVIAAICELKSLPGL
jgi:hypothetical protein